MIPLPGHLLLINCWLIHFCFFLDCIFPVLDILRLAVRNEDINTRLSSDKYIFGYLKDNLQEDSPVANQMLSLRTLCNLLIHKAGEQLLLDHKDFIIETLGHFSGLSNKSLQVSNVRGHNEFGIASSVI